ncbi:DUF3885 domain-containing protein [Halalkalibacter alkalisediminis]|uniref:DUF3885 domain-containing protein n=2 Tax=Halalkalibacter alkalisediminis TaxID=935616 RepID=A0ABV6NLA4_9BACI|nr:DUF3885 domain-containing protein [Halalkalibacter alkalisediminis]
MRLLEQLMKNSNYWIRFELGLIQLEDKEYIHEMHHRATIILNSMFDKNDGILIFAHVSNPVDYKGIDIPNIKRFIKNKKLIYDLKCKTIPFEFDEEDTEMETKQYSLKVKKNDIRLGYLIQSIGYKEFRMKPRVNGTLYLLNSTKKMLFHMYDDRGCDVYGLEKGKLLPLYHKFRKWILDYNRIQIDRMFGDGLFSIYETPEDMKKRLELNRKKVEETEINLYEVNTCHITHKLEIPKEFAEECLSEMAQTGFEINIEQKFSDSIILKAMKTEALALVEYQTELMSLYSRKFKGEYVSWSAIRAF